VRAVKESAAPRLNFVTAEAHTGSTRSTRALTVSVALAAGLATCSFAIDEPASSAQSAAARRCNWDVEPQKLFHVVDGMAAISRRDLWAVGHRLDKRAIAHPVAAHRVGGQWRRVNVPVRKGPYYLSAVAFASANDGWAVGTGLPSDAIERWDGHRWRVVRTPDLGERGTALNDVAVVGTNDVWAVGQSTPPDNAGASQALVDHWDGLRWEHVPTPDVGPSQLLALAAISRNNVWAVGNQIKDTLIEHWDGTSWEVMRSPVAPLGALNDIAAISANDIWVVGSQGAWPARKRPLIQHWNGTKWQLVSAPLSARYLAMSSVAVSKGDIWITAVSKSDVIVKRRVGSSWQSVKTPRIRGQHDLIIEEAAGRDEIWALAKVRYVFDARDRIEHYHCRS
jgi:hypothetical protein